MRLPDLLFHDDGDAAPRRVRRGVFVALALVAIGSVLAAVFLLWPREHEPALWTVRHPAARTVDRLLKVRRSRAVETTAYAPFFENPALAEELALDAPKAKGSPIPSWAPPYVSSVTTPNAEVVVRWRPDDTHPSWIPATVFSLRFAGGTWLVSDAQPVPDAEEIPRAAEER